MTDHMKIGQLYPATLPPGNVRIGSKTGAASSEKNFQQVLSEETLKFSHHAELRLKQRGIQLEPEQLRKIGSALDKAAAKGAKDSLLIMNDLALIANVRNRTIVTAMDGESLRDNVFTHIDSAVVVS
ncbi:MAG: flagellar biosynthesis protein [Paenibacillaceae bacterium]|jgi:flagellar operon protein|nr:flagellar biosynthesis protein [Paenibacillaceae bacterium]